MPIYDGLNEVDIFFDAFEMEVLEKKHFQGVGLGPSTTPTR